MKRRRVTVGGLERFFHAPTCWLQQVFEKSCLEERLGAEGTEVPLPLPVNNALNAKASAVNDARCIVKEDRKQWASVAAEAQRPSAEPFSCLAGRSCDSCDNRRETGQDEQGRE